MTRMPRRILFVSHINLKNPVRGTPIRLYEVLKQIKTRHELTVCAADVNDDLQPLFVPYPPGKGWSKLMQFRKLVKDRRIEIVFATENSIKLPIILKWFTGVKICMDVHGLQAEELFFRGFIGPWKRIWITSLYRMYFAWYDLLFVVSDKLKSFYRMSNKKIVTVWGGVNLETFYRPRKASNSSVLTIGYTGNARSYQGLDHLFAAMKVIKERNLFAFRLQLILSGDEDEVKRSLMQSGLTEQTSIRMSVPHREMGDALQEADVLVIPRPSVPMTEYAYPSKLSEYLATGVPVVITDVGPTTELFAQEKPCIVIPPHDVEALVAALGRVAKMSAEERNAMGEASVAFARKHLTWDAVGEKINHALDQL